MPLTSKFLSHSVILFHMKFNAVPPSRALPRCTEGRGIRSIGSSTEQARKKRDERHSDQGHAAARHELSNTQLNVAGGGIVVFCP